MTKTSDPTPSNPPQKPDAIPKALGGEGGVAPPMPAGEAAAKPQAKVKARPRPLDGKTFRPFRGPPPVLFWVPALVLAASAVALGVGTGHGGWLATPPALLAGTVGGYARLELAVAALAVVAGVLALVAAWAHGRRINIEADAALVHMAQGEAGGALMITTPDGAVIYANRAFRRLFRETGPARVPEGLNMAPSAHKAITDEAFRRLLGQGVGGGTDHEEMAFAGADGSEEWWRVSVRPMGGRLKRKNNQKKNNPPRCVVWTAREVTARRALDAVRRQEEGLLADLLDNLPVGFFSVNGAGELVYANDVLCAWLGTSLGEIQQKKLSFADFVIASGAFVSDGDGGESKTSPQRTGLHGEVTLEGLQGETFRAFLLQSGRLSADGELLYTRSVVVRDVARRGTETTDGDGAMDAHEAARRLYWLFDEAPVAIAMLDLQGNVTDCNRAFQRLLGSHKDSILAHPFADRLAKEDRGDVAAQLSKVVMGIMRAAHLEVRMPAAAGREVMASLYASRVEDAFGEVTGLILHFIDTTEQKHLEVQFAQSQKMQAIGQLAGGIAHDFNNLLTAMIGFSDLLLARHGPDDPSFADIQQIKQNANRATNLVRQLLTFSRKGGHQVPVVFDPNEALSDLSSMLSRLLESPIALNMETDPELGHVRMDRSQFDQVVINFAVNAKDAMPGGGTLTVRTQNLALSESQQRGIDLVEAGEYVCIDVIDTGTGIRKEDIGRIFEPFFSTKEVGEGTGLGLSTVYGIIHQAGGHVFVDSAPGEGTVFTLLLPRLSSEARRRSGAQATAADGQKAIAQVPVEIDLTGSGTILLVEDEDAVRMFGARALKNKGYTVLEAANGEVALDVINAATQSIDLIVTDVVMPGMDGYTLVQFVRQEMPDVKVIFISGYADNVVPGGFGEKDYTFLPKPFSLKDLAQTVKTVLES